MLSGISTVNIFNSDCVDILLSEGGVGGSSPGAATGSGGDGEDGGEAGAGEEEDKGQQKQVPDYKTQRTEIHAALQQRLKQGDTW